jgi:hypothetical protein
MAAAHVSKTNARCITKISTAISLIFCSAMEPGEEGCDKLDYSILKSLLAFAVRLTSYSHNH